LFLAQEGLFAVIADVLADSSTIREHHSRYGNKKRLSSKPDICAILCCIGLKAGIQPTPTPVMKTTKTIFERIAHFPAKHYGNGVARESKPIKRNDLHSPGEKALFRRHKTEPKIRRRILRKWKSACRDCP
jgi:hypothetical protein